jgi:hypothetical protein
MWGYKYFLGLAVGLSGASRKASIHAALRRFSGVGRDCAAAAFEDGRAAPFGENT